MAIYEDAYGIVVAGAMRPNVTPEQVRELRASPLSGDWRPLQGRSELVALLAVNTPGFLIPRVASGALVAAGFFPHDPCDECDVELYEPPMEGEDPVLLARVAALEAHELRKEFGVVAAGDWNEEDHPREGGKFAPKGSGGGDSGKDAKKAEKQYYNTGLKKLSEKLVELPQSGDRNAALSIISEARGMGVNQMVSQLEFLGRFTDSKVAGVREAAAEASKILKDAPPPATRHLK